LVEFSPFEFVSEVEAASLFVVDEFFGRAFEEDLAIDHEVGAIDDLEGFPDLVIGDENGEAIVFAEFADDGVNFLNGEGVDSDEWFVEHEETWICAEAAGDGEAAFFTPGEGEGEGFPDGEDAEAVHEFLGPVVAFFPGEIFTCFEDGEEVVLDGEFSEDGFFLGEVAEAETGPFVKGEAGDVFVLEADASSVWRDEAGDHVKGGSFSGSVRAEEADDFAFVDFETDFPDYGAAAVAF